MAQDHRKEAEERQRNLQNDVLEALSNMPDLDISAVSIQVDKSTVRLIGQVDDELGRDEAEDIVRNVPGVDKVENHLIAMPRTPLSDLPGASANRPSVQ